MSTESNTEAVATAKAQKDAEESRNAKQFEKMISKPIGKLLLDLSIPTILSMMVTNLYNLVDTAFVGQLGTSESGATGIVFGYMSILQAVAFMCGQGAGSIMSRKLGAKDQEAATRYTSTGFCLSFGLGLLIAVLSYIFMAPLLRVLGSSDTIAPHARTYITYILLSAPFFTSSLTMNNLLRYEGKAKLGTVGMLTGSFLNIGGDALFMFGCKMGMAGAGLSTCISQLVSFSILFSMYMRKKTQTKIGVQYVARDAKTFWNILATGFPSMLRQGLFSVATMLLNQSARNFGDQAVAAMSIVSRVSFFPTACSIGIGQGFQPISSFNYGAKRNDRVRKAFWTAIYAEECALILMSLPLFIFAAPIIAQLRDDAQVVEIGVRALRLMCLSQAFVPLSMMVEMGFQSIGEKLMATISSSLRSGLVLIPVLLFFTNTRGLNGIQEAQPVAVVVTFFASVFLCKIYLEKLKD